MKQSKFSKLLMQRWYVIVAALALLGVMTWSFQPRPIPVEVVTIDQGIVRTTLIDEARTRMHETYVVSAPINGELVRVTVEPGDAVKQGDPLARLSRNRPGFVDPRTDASTQSSIAAAQSRLRAATAAREYAALELDRAQKLADSKLIATTTLDSARTRLRTANAEEAAAKAELSRARSALLPAETENSATQIALVAPASGYILEVRQESATAVQAGTPIIVLGDPSRIDIVAEFLSQDALRIEAGDTALIENWSTGESASRSIRAIVERVEPTARTKISALGIEEQRTRVILRFDEKVPDELRAHQYRVDARVILDQVDKVVRVPPGALFRDGDDWGVFIVRDKRARVQRVELGARGDDFTEIKNGLRVGDKVVVFPSRELSDGARVVDEDSRS
jgi:HlyD family secretion protein